MVHIELMKENQVRMLENQRTPLSIWYSSEKKLVCYYKMYNKDMQPLYYFFRNIRNIT